MNLVRPKKRSESENIIPLINIVFLLLIFFMITAKLASSDAIEIHPPVSAQPASEQSQDGLTIYLNHEDKIYFDGHSLSPHELFSILSTQPESKDTRSITLKADSNASARKLVSILDTLKQSGIKKIELLTQSKPL